MELLSFAGTAVTGVVAVVAFSSWRTQFRHMEKFKALKELNDASRDLHRFLDYLNAIAYREMVALDGGPNVEDLARAEDVARQQWYAALDVYGKAWGGAVVFLAAEEADSFCGPVKIFYERTNEYLLKIRMSYADSHPDDRMRDLLIAAAEASNSAGELYRKTLIGIDKMLARHAVA
jgi:hypothetical protein